MIWAWQSTSIWFYLISVHTDFRSTRFTHNGECWGEDSEEWGSPLSCIMPLYIELISTSNENGCDVTLDVIHKALQEIWYPMQMHIYSDFIITGREETVMCDPVEVSCCCDILAEMETSSIIRSQRLHPCIHGLAAFRSISVSMKLLPRWWTIYTISRLVLVLISRKWNYCGRRKVPGVHSMMKRCRIRTACGCFEWRNKCFLHSRLQSTYLSMRYTWHIFYGTSAYSHLRIVQLMKTERCVLLLTTHFREPFSSCYPTVEDGVMRNGRFSRIQQYSGRISEPPCSKPSACGIFHIAEVFAQLNPFFRRRGVRNMLNGLAMLQWTWWSHLLPHSVIEEKQ